MPLLVKGIEANPTLSRCSVKTVASETSLGQNWQHLLSKETSPRELTGSFHSPKAKEGAIHKSDRTATNAIQKKWWGTFVLFFDPYRFDSSSGYTFAGLRSSEFFSDPSCVQCKTLDCFPQRPFKF